MNHLPIEYCIWFQWGPNKYMLDPIREKCVKNIGCQNDLSINVYIVLSQAQGVLVQVLYFCNFHLLFFE